MGYLPGRRHELHVLRSGCLQHAHRTLGGIIIGPGTGPVVPCTLQVHESIRCSSTIPCGRVIVRYSFFPETPTLLPSLSLLLSRLSLLLCPLSSLRAKSSFDSDRSSLSPARSEPSNPTGCRSRTRTHPVVGAGCTGGRTVSVVRSPGTAATGGAGWCR